MLFPDESGELGHTILEDISNRKDLESKHKRVYDAQETILQLATHDLKGPIAHIELLVDLLQREVANRSGEGPDFNPGRCAAAPSLAAKKPKLRIIEGIKKVCPAGQK